MNPRLMLSLWRERWGKAAGTSFKVPYVRGKINRWTQELPHADIWSVTGVSAVTLLVCLMLLGLMMGIALSLNSQIVFSAVFVSLALYARRYTGTLITLVLVGMAIIASSRYLYWRFNATLVQDFSLDFLFGFYLFVAECYLALLVFTGLVRSIWPLKRARSPLPTKQDEWPTIDVFILCHDQPYAAIKATSLAARQLEWPIKKIKIYLIGGDQRGDLQALAGSIQAQYLPNADPNGSHAEFVNMALPSTNGELVAVFQSGQLPDTNFLNSTVGWFLRDQKLGMALTPHHFLIPAPSKNDLEVFDSRDFAESCALLRRSAVVQLEDGGASLVGEPSHLVFKLQESGYGCAYIGFAERKPPTHQNQDATTAADTPPTPTIFLVEHAFIGRTLLLKRWLASFHGVLQFYYPVPRLLFYTAPVMYLLGNVQIIQTSPELLAAYAIPHFLHGHIARTRMDGRDRFTLFADIKEAVLAWYLLVPTTLTLLRTKLSQLLRLLPADESDRTGNTSPKTRFSLGVGLPYMFVLYLNLAGFVSGMSGVLLSSTSPREITVMFLLWSAYNLMLLAAVFAIAEEARQVLKHTRSRLRMPVMIKLPSGRTVSCTTENFPEPVLKLVLPTPVAVEAGSPVSISIFHGHREVVLSAMVLTRRDLALSLSVAEATLSDYQNFAVSALSRGPEWPKWLPGQRADRPLPKWVTDTLIAGSIAVLDFATNINKHLRWVRLDSWIQLWKKRND
jgi:cellulose synthase (UDP-forming)